MRSVVVFYGRFAAAYGTCWFVLVLLAVVTQSRIDTGAFGVIGFPLIGVVYAIMRIWIRFDPAAGERGRGFDVIVAKAVVAVEEETAEEMIARRLGHAKIFVVKGVDRKTLDEKTMKITADSKESAGFKAELEGLDVTVVYEE